MPGSWTGKSANTSNISIAMTEESSPPRFRIGERVWAPNGEPRVVTSMRWCRFIPPDSDPDESYESFPWGWAVGTVHPDDDSVKGEGHERYYELRY
jgi:hypothetical protein